MTRPDSNDMSSIITSVNNTTERRQVFVETSLDKSFMRGLNQPKSLCGTSNTAEWQISCLRMIST